MEPETINIPMPNCDVLMPVPVSNMANNVLLDKNTIYGIGWYLTLY